MRYARKTRGSQKTVNRAGGEAFKLSPKEIVAQIVPTYLVGEPKYYGGVEETLGNALDKVAKEDPEFILKLAAYTRNEMFLRTVSVYLLTKAANTVACKEFVRKYTPYILRRADELYEAVSCHRNTFSERKDNKDKSDKALKLPNSLKKGIAEAFAKFDEYQFGKYNRKTDVNFKDVIMLTHPKEPEEIIKKILDDKLEVPYTWETELSEKGNKPEVWHKLIDSGKLPYMAMLRNINNIDKAEVDDDHWGTVLSKIKDPVLVKKSRQLPFRFYSALKNTQVSDPFRRKELENALNEALTTSVQNLTKLPGKTFVVSDVSGSMDSRLSSRGSMTFKEIGCLMAAMANKFSDTAISGVFADKLAVVPSLTGDILRDTDYLSRINVGWCTNGYLTLRYLNDNHIKCDRVIIFTDMELYGGSIQEQLNSYLKNMNPKLKLYVINLNGYGESCINTHNKSVVTASGWSDRILEFISLSEKGGKAFIELIDNYSTPKRG